MIGVIEHQEIGEFLLAEFARHVRQREQALRHGGEGEEVLALVPHHHVEPDMVARQRQDPAARVPDRDRERTAQHRPEVVAELLPGGQQDARIRPGHGVLRRHSDAGEHVVAIVEPHVGGDHRAAGAAPRLAVELVLRRHAHQHMDEADVAGDRHIGPIGAVRAERVGHAFEVVPRHRLAVEAQQAGDAAHAKRAIARRGHKGGDARLRGLML